MISVQPGVCVCVFKAMLKSWVFYLELFYYPGVWSGWLKITGHPCVALMMLHPGANVSTRFGSASLANIKVQTHVCVLTDQRQQLCRRWSCWSNYNTHVRGKKTHTKTCLPAQVQLRCLCAHRREQQSPNSFMKNRT